VASYLPIRTAGRAGANKNVFDYSLEHIFSYTATLSPPEVIGPLPEGVRVNFYVTGGEVKGPKVYGKFRPVGADWLSSYAPTGWAS